MLLGLILWEPGETYSVLCEYPNLFSSDLSAIFSISERSFRLELMTSLITVLSLESRIALMGHTLQSGGCLRKPGEVSTSNAAPSAESTLGVV